MTPAAFVKGVGANAVYASPTDPPDGIWDELLPAREVHVWRAGLTAGAGALEALATALDDHERERAARFAFDVDRHRYVVAHGVLRRLLGRYLHASPGSIRFVRGRHGKPYLHPGSGSPLQFNLSHSGDSALFTVSAGPQVGIDIQQVRADRDLLGIADRFFSARERQALRTLPAEDVVAAFYRCWTRKEAYMKATGDGMTMALDSFDVTFAPGAPPALLRSARGDDEPRRWKLLGLAAGPGFEAALAVEGDNWRLRGRVPFACDVGLLLS